VGDTSKIYFTKTSKLTGKTTIRGEIVKQYLAKYPTAGNRTLAMLITKENPEVFYNVEHARDLIRYYRGAGGAKKRLRSPKQFFTAAAFEKLRREEEIYSIEIPDSDYDTTWQPVPVITKRCVVLCDLHIPFQAQEALEAAIKYSLEYQPDTIILNGDLVDHYNLSQFLKDPRVKDYAHERKCTLQFLVFLRNTFPKSRIIWKEGNHEYWYFKHMAKTGGALMKVKHFHMESVYRLEELNVEYVNDNKPIAIYGLWILHGHELSKNSIGVPVNPARSVYLKAATTMLVGHHHITSEHTTQNAKGEITTTWSVGCLSGLRPPYARFSKYNNGFALIECDPLTQTFHVLNKKIYKGKII
jgi:predicted phosphodiesterase